MISTYINSVIPYGALYARAPVHRCFIRGEKSSLTPGHFTEVFKVIHHEHFLKGIHLYFEDSKGPSLSSRLSLKFNRYMYIIEKW